MGAFIGPETSFEIVLSSRVYEAELGTGDVLPLMCKALVSAVALRKLVE
jgi:hypothetical protein